MVPTGTQLPFLNFASWSTIGWSHMIWYLLQPVLRISPQLRSNGMGQMWIQPQDTSFSRETRRPSIWSHCTACGNCCAVYLSACYWKQRGHLLVWWQQEYPARSSDKWQREMRLNLIKFRFLTNHSLNRDLACPMIYQSVIQIRVQFQLVELLGTV